MVTTIDDSHNGFRKTLLPAALSDTTMSSKGLLQAVLAVSASHLWGAGAAVKYKLAAIKLLSNSFEANEEPNVSQFSTCMMLCICDLST